MSTWFHVTSVLNRASITKHGLDWTRMRTAPGIAGSQSPEQAGVFFSATEFDAGFFVRLNAAGGPVDIWAVDDVDEARLVTSTEGFHYLPTAVPAHRLTLVRRDVRPGNAAYDSELTLTFDAPVQAGRDVEPVRVVRGADLVAADPTPGMHRERAFQVSTLWSGRVTTAPGAVSGWHHHDLNQTSLYVVSGTLRLEFGGGDGHLDAHAGDFVHVPAYTVHRESNPTDEPSVAIIARAGGGIPTVNVELP